ncbi:unnamed protein product [Ceratitis capitata]|uniref:(Mediterranean fruit fly) hypothetical protein n=1 Tax=Ceratitis capitata TaxID=7213 RepID=A0A811V369_CERCA|nr:unnamed protein product [Ceratitis capitata]
MKYLQYLQIMFKSFRIGESLCLPRLLNLVECRVIEDLTMISQSETNETVDHCLKLLEPVKLHNAHQLAEWCMSYLCVNYNIFVNSHSKASKRCIRIIRSIYVNIVGHQLVLKDFDYYQRCINEMNKELKNSRRDSRSDDEGCLCFTGVFSWLLGSSGGGKSKRITDPNSNGGGTGDHSTTDNQIFNSTANSMNQLDLEAAEVDLNL